MNGLDSVGGCAPADRSADVVFVHGLGGDPRETWMSAPRDAETFWPAWLAADFPRVGVWVLGYAADVSRWKAESMPVADVGKAVLERL